MGSGRGMPVGVRGEWELKLQREAGARGSVYNIRGNKSIPQIRP